MKLTKEKLEFVRGDDQSFRLLILNPDKTPADLINATFDLHARIDDKDEPVIQLSSENGSIQVATGRLVLHFSHEMTKEVTWETADYDLQMRKDGKRRTILQGKIKLIPDQTRI